MGDYYIQSINKTFFLSGSLIYHTNNSGSNANKSNGTLINRDYIYEVADDGDYEFLKQNPKIISGKKIVFNDQE